MCGGQRDAAPDLLRGEWYSFSTTACPFRLTASGHNCSVCSPKKVQAARRCGGQRNKTATPPLAKPLGACGHQNGAPSILEANCQRGLRAHWGRADTRTVQDNSRSKSPAGTPRRCLIHAACGYRGHRRLGLLDVGYQRLGSQDHCCNGCCILQCRSRYLGRVNDAGRDHIDILLVVRIKAVADLVCADDLVDDNAALQTCVQCDLTERCLQCGADDLCTCLLVAVELADQLLYCRDRIDQSSTAAGYDAFLYGCLGRCQSILDAELLLLHLGRNQK